MDRLSTAIETLRPRGPRATADSPALSSESAERIRTHAAPQQVPFDATAPGHNQGLPQMLVFLWSLFKPKGSNSQKGHYDSSGPSCPGLISVRFGRVFRA